MIWDLLDSIWAKLDEGKTGFESLHFMQNFAVKYVQQNFVYVQKNACVWLVVERVVHMGF